MKKLNTFVIIFLCFNAVSFGQFPINNFNLPDSYGQNHNLHTYLSTGHAVIIDFFMLSCANCSDFAPDLEQIYQNFGSNTLGVKVLSMEVSDTASDASINNWKTTHGTTYPSIGGHDAYNYWNINLVPYLTTQVNQIIAIIPFPGNPTLSTVPYIEIGPMNALKIQNLYTELANYGYAAQINEEENSIKNIQIYPNPAKDLIFIDNVDAETVNLTIEVFSMQGGKVIFNEVLDIINKLSLDISSLSNGIYVLKVTCGKHVKIDKLNVIK